MDFKQFVSVSDFARNCKIPAKTLAGNFRRGSMGPSTAKKIAESLGVSYHWLKTGHGAPFPVADGDNESKAVFVKPECVPTDERPIESYAYIRKAKAKLSAGGGWVAEEGFESDRFGFLKSWLRLKASAINDDTLFLIDVEGDSMVPTFQSGDMVLVDRGMRELRAEGYFAIGEGGFINIKKLRREDDMIHIISDNEDRSLYPTRIVKDDDIRIIGRVIWMGREVS